MLVMCHWSNGLIAPDFNRNRRQLFIAFTSTHIHFGLRESKQLCAQGAKHLEDHGKAVCAVAERPGVALQRLDVVPRFSEVAEKLLRRVSYKPGSLKYSSVSLSRS
jgi:hypothetical protein